MIDSRRKGEKGHLSRSFDLINTFLWHFYFHDHLYTTNIK